MSGLFSRIDTVIVRVRDIAKAKQWYSEVLELKPIFEQQTGNKIVVYEVGEVQIDGSIRFFRFYDEDGNELQACGTVA